MPGPEFTTYAHGEGEAMLRGQVITSAKVAKTVIVVAHGDMAIFVLTHCFHSACLSGKMNSSDDTVVSCAMYIQPHRNMQYTRGTNGEGVIFESLKVLT